ncbi:UNVERIFIED_CONTAM: hypothetical protein FKN15_004899 [Acipenser sinensis]
MKQYEASYRVPHVECDRQRLMDGQTRLSKTRVTFPVELYEVSVMNLEQERPFVCNAPGCSQYDWCLALGFHCWKPEDWSEHFDAWLSRTIVTPAPPHKDDKPRHQHCDSASHAVPTVQFGHHTSTFDKQTDRVLDSSTKHKLFSLIFMSDVRNYKGTEPTYLEQGAFVVSLGCGSIHKRDQVGVAGHVDIPRTYLRAGCGGNLTALPPRARGISAGGHAAHFPSSVSGVVKPLEGHQARTVTRTVPVPMAPLGDLRHRLHATALVGNQALP